MEKLKDESYISYVKRITNQCKDKKITFSEWGDYILGDENVYSDDNCRKGFYIVRKILDRLDDNCEVTDVSIQLELDKLKDELYKERCKLQDANREKRKALRDFSRIETLIEYIDKRLEEKEPLNFKYTPYETKGDNEACLLVSDIHYGMTTDSIFNYYDTNIAKERLEELARKTIAKCEKEDVSLLHIEILGDDISGIIHGATIAESQEDVIDQALNVSELLAEFVKTIAEKVPKVKVYSTYGNHARTTQSKTASPNKENFERLIPRYMNKEFKKCHLDLLVIENGYEDFVEFNLRDGRTIIATHGTKDSKINAKSSFCELLNKEIFEVHMGHLHSVAINNGTTVNGSIMSSDSFAISIRKHTRAEQVLKVYYNDGDIATYQIGLK